MCPADRQCTFAKLVDTVLAFLVDAPEDTAVWIDIFAINQHVDTCLDINTADVAAFEDTIKICTMGTIVVIDMKVCSPATRAWCLFEWDHTVVYNGQEALLLTGMEPEDRRDIVRQIDVSKAECFAPGDKIMILDKIKKHHGSLTAFDNKLRLQLLLTPLAYSVDLKELKRRSEGTTWAFGAVKAWLDSDQTGRALCIFAGAGTGKSTISAALLDYLHDQGYLTACHFNKHSDARRLDPVRIIKSIAFQLALSIPDLAFKLLELDGLLIDKINKPEDAYRLLLQPFASFIGQQSTTIRSPVILLDALDEADPAHEQESGFDPSKHPVIPVANKVLSLLTALLAKLPVQVRFILTARKETARSSLEVVLHRAFKKVSIIEPHQLRLGDQHGSQGKGVLVYDTVVKECQLERILTQRPAATNASLLDLYAAYKAVFDRDEPHGQTLELIEVLMAAMEPLPLSLLQKMGLIQNLDKLPGWKTLFYVAEHRVYFLHKSLSDWLRLARRNHTGGYTWGVGGDDGQGLVTSGHVSLGSYLVEKEAPKAADGGDKASEYALKYAVHHVCASGSSARIRDKLLSNWPFLRQSIAAGHGSAVVESLSVLESSTDLKGESLLNSYGQDTLQWLRAFLHDFEANPNNMEKITISFAPLQTFKRFEAALRYKGPKCSKILGGTTRNQKWSRESIFKGHGSSVIISIQ